MIVVCFCAFVAGTLLDVGCFVAMVVLAKDRILLLLGRCLSWVMCCGRSEFGADLTWFCLIFEIFDYFVAGEWSESVLVLVLVLGGFC